MVRQVLSTVLYTNDTISYVGLMPFSLILPDYLPHLYKEYYTQGTGAIVLSFFAVIVLFELIFSEKIQQIVAKTIIVVLLFFYNTNHSISFFEYTFPKNAFFTPIPAISPHIVIFLLALLFLPLHISFFNRLKSLLHYKVYLVMLVFQWSMWFLLCLPYFSGEVFL